LYSFDLVQQAMDRKAVIVVLRAWREWQVAVPGLADYDRLVQTRNKQASYITSKNVTSRTATHSGGWELIRGALLDDL
jgi:hypothetical protein